ncbi:CDC-like kinase 1, partial [Reticulomyxa filosa]
KILQLPVNPRIKLVDFGSAVYEPKYDPENEASWKFRDGYNYLIQTRHYRAPEVVLEMHWKKPVDVWSIGCIILEFLHGSMIFNTHCSIDHLNQMQSLLGSIPHKFISSTPSHKFKELFDPDTLCLKMEQANQSRAQARHLETYFDFNKLEHINLYDLVKRMLRWLASDRITAKEIMQHQYWIVSDPVYKQRLLLTHQQLSSPAPPMVQFQSVPLQLPFQTQGVTERTILTTTLPSQK